VQPGPGLISAFGIRIQNIPAPLLAQSKAQQRTNKHANVLTAGVCPNDSGIIGGTNHVE
jgi:hypothetical protein